jgi:hypothetical protein
MLNIGFSAYHSEQRGYNFARTLYDTVYDAMPERFEAYLGAKNLSVLRKLSNMPWQAAAGSCRRQARQNPAQRQA